MANTLAPGGFRVARSALASATVFATQPALIAYNYGSKIGRGDPVALNSSGNIVLYANGGTQVFGIFDGCEYFDPVQQAYQRFNYWPAPGTLASGAIVTAFVYTDPFLTFECQATTGSAFAQSNMGQNVDIVAGTAGAPNLAGISTCALDLANVGNTATLPFQIRGVVGFPGISSTYSGSAQYPWLEVRMNTSEMLGTTGI